MLIEFFNIEFKFIKNSVMLKLIQKHIKIKFDVLVVVFFLLLLQKYKIKIFKQNSNKITRPPNQKINRQHKMNNAIAIFDYFQDTFHLFRTDQISPNRVNSFCLQDSFAFAITDTCQIYQWGEIPCGISKNLESQKKFMDFLMTKPVSLIKTHLQEIVYFKVLSCNRTAVIGVSSSNKLYSWGHDQNKYGFLGQNKCFSLPQPTLINDLSEININYASLGNKHAAALDTLGNLYLWGSGSSGETGLITKSVLYAPVHIANPTLTYLCKVSCHNQLTTLIDKMGRVLLLGSFSPYEVVNYQQAFAVNDSKEKNKLFSTIYEVKSLKGMIIRDVALGDFFAAAIDEYGRLFLIDPSHDSHNLVGLEKFISFTAIKRKIYAISENFLYEFDLGKAPIGENNVFNTNYITVKVTKFYTWCINFEFMQRESSSTCLSLYFEENRAIEQNIYNKTAFSFNKFFPITLKTLGERIFRVDGNNLFDQKMQYMNWERSKYDSPKKKNKESFKLLDQKKPAQPLELHFQKEQSYKSSLIIKDKSSLNNLENVHNSLKLNKSETGARLRNLRINLNQILDKKKEDTLYRYQPTAIQNYSSPESKRIIEQKKHLNNNYPFFIEKDQRSPYAQYSGHKAKEDSNSKKMTPKKEDYSQIIVERSEVDEIDRKLLELRHQRKQMNNDGKMECQYFASKLKLSDSQKKKITQSNNIKISHFEDNPHLHPESIDENTKFNDFNVLIQKDDEKVMKSEMVQTSFYLLNQNEVENDLLLNEKKYSVPTPHDQSADEISVVLSNPEDRVSDDILRNYRKKFKNTKLQTFENIPKESRKGNMDHQHNKHFSLGNQREIWNKLSQKEGDNKIIVENNAKPKNSIQNDIRNYDFKKPERNLNFELVQAANEKNVEYFDFHKNDVEIKSQTINNLFSKINTINPDLAQTIKLEYDQEVLTDGGSLSNRFKTTKSSNNPEENQINNLNSTNSLSPKENYAMKIKNPLYQIGLNEKNFQNSPDPLAFFVQSTDRSARTSKEEISNNTEIASPKWTKSKEIGPFFSPEFQNMNYSQGEDIETNKKLKSSEKSSDHNLMISTESFQNKQLFNKHQINSDKDQNELAFSLGVNSGFQTKDTNENSENKKNALQHASSLLVDENIRVDKSLTPKQRAANRVNKIIQRANSLSQALGVSMKQSSKEKISDLKASFGEPDIAETNNIEHPNSQETHTSDKIIEASSLTKVPLMGEEMQKKIDKNENIPKKAEKILQNNQNNVENKQKFDSVSAKNGCTFGNINQLNSGSAISMSKEMKIKSIKSDNSNENANKINEEAFPQQQQNSNKCSISEGSASEFPLKKVESNDKFIIPKHVSKDQAKSYDQNKMQNSNIEISMQSPEKKNVSDEKKLLLPENDCTEMSSPSINVFIKYCNYIINDFTNARKCWAFSNLHKHSVKKLEERKYKVRPFLSVISTIMKMINSKNIAKSFELIKLTNTFFKMEQSSAKKSSLQNESMMLSQRIGFFNVLNRIIKRKLINSGFKALQYLFQAHSNNLHLSQQVKVMLLSLNGHWNDIKRKGFLKLKNYSYRINASSNTVYQVLNKIKLNKVRDGWNQIANIHSVYINNKDKINKLLRLDNILLLKVCSYKQQSMTAMKQRSNYFKMRLVLIQEASKRLDIKVIKIKYRRMMNKLLNLKNDKSIKPKLTQYNEFNINQIFKAIKYIKQEQLSRTFSLFVAYMKWIQLCKKKQELGFNAIIRFFYFQEKLVKRIALNQITNTIKCEDFYNENLEKLLCKISNIRLRVIQETFVHVKIQGTLTFQVMKSNFEILKIRFCGLKTNFLRSSWVALSDNMLKKNPQRAKPLCAVLEKLCQKQNFFKKDTFQTIRIQNKLKINQLKAIGTILKIKIIHLVRQRYQLCFKIMQSYQPNAKNNQKLNIPFGFAHMEMMTFQSPNLKAWGEGGNKLENNINSQNKDEENINKKSSSPRLFEENVSTSKPLDPPQNNIINSNENKYQNNAVINQNPEGMDSNVRESQNLPDLKHIKNDEISTPLNKDGNKKNLQLHTEEEKNEKCNIQNDDKFLGQSFSVHDLSKEMLEFDESSIKAENFASNLMLTPENILKHPGFKNFLNQRLSVPDQKNLLESKDGQKFIFQSRGSDQQTIEELLKTSSIINSPQKMSLIPISESQEIEDQSGKSAPISTSRDQTQKDTNKPTQNEGNLMYPSKEQKKMETQNVENAFFQMDNNDGDPIEGESENRNLGNPAEKQKKKSMKTEDNPNSINELGLQNISESVISNSEQNAQENIKKTSLKNSIEQMLKKENKSNKGGTNDKKSHGSASSFSSKDSNQKKQEKSTKLTKLTSAQKQQSSPSIVNQSKSGGGSTPRSKKDQQILETNSTSSKNIPENDSLNENKKISSLKNQKTLGQISKLKSGSMEGIIDQTKNQPASGKQNDIKKPPLSSQGKTIEKDKIVSSKSGKILPRPNEISQQSSSKDILQDAGGKNVENEIEKNALLSSKAQADATKAKVEGLNMQKLNARKKLTPSQFEAQMLSVESPRTFQSALPLGMQQTSLPSYISNPDLKKSASNKNMILHQKGKQNEAAFVVKAESNQKSSDEQEFLRATLKAQAEQLTNNENKFTKLFKFNDSKNKRRISEQSIGDASSDFKGYSVVSNSGSGSHREETNKKGLNKNMSQSRKSSDFYRYKQSFAENKSIDQNQSESRSIINSEGGSAGKSNDRKSLKEYDNLDFQDRFKTVRDLYNSNKYVKISEAKKQYQSPQNVLKDIEIDFEEASKNLQSTPN